uniref:sulfate transport system permease protein n=1 Tax=Prototheca paracutis TaxID=2034905 RepID=UPI0030037989
MAVPKKRKSKSKKNLQNLRRKAQIQAKKALSKAKKILNLLKLKIDTISTKLETKIDNYCDNVDPTRGTCIGIMSYSFFILVLPISILYRKLFLEYTWEQILEKAFDPVAIATYKLTFSLALFTAVFNTAFGFCVAWIITRFNFRGRTLIDKMVDVPLCLPTSAGGIALTSVFGNKGLLGPMLQAANIKIVYSKIGVLLAMMFVSFPFVVRSVQPIIERFDIEMEEAAWCAGGSPYETASRVIFPALIPALISGFTITFARSIGEFGTVVMLSSNLALDDLVTSVLVFQSLEQYDLCAARSITGTIIIFAYIFLFTMNSARSIYNRRTSRYYY